MNIGAFSTGLKANTLVFKGFIDAVKSDGKTRVIMNTSEISTAERDKENPQDIIITKVNSKNTGEEGDKVTICASINTLSEKLNAADVIRQADRFDAGCDPNKPY